MQILNKDEQELSYVRLKKEKDRLRILEAKDRLTVQEFLASDLKGLSICLSMDGKGIITKQVDQEHPFSAVIAPASAEDFFYNCYKSSQEQLISFSRKAHVHAVLNAFHEAGFQVAKVVLGAYSPVLLYPLIQATPARLHTGYATLVLENGKLASIVPQASPEATAYLVEEEEVPARRLIPFANAVLCLMNLSLFASSNLPDQRLELAHKSIFNKLLATTLTFLFLLLLANFLWNTELQASHEKLSEQYLVYSHQAKELERLERKRDEKLAIVKNFGLQQAPRFAYHTDLLGASVPKEITLSRLELHPEVAGKSRKDVSYAYGRIGIEGFCSSPITLNNWLMTLEQQEWVAAIEGQSFVTLQGNTANQFAFTIVLREHE